jgi:DNA-binding transcriptional regulator PaaX
MAELNLTPQDQKSSTVSVITVVAGGLLLSGSVIAPNLLQLFAKAVSPDPKTSRTLRAIRYAKANGWLTFKETDKGVKVALTESGKLKWQAIQLTQPLTSSYWDKKWRFVLFDIPVSRKANAQEFRRSLKKLGVRQLQQSVWITPYPCQTHIAILRQLYDIKRYVRLVEAETVEDEAELKRLFNL